MQADGSTDAANGKFRIDFANTGEAGACLQVRSGNTADGPRTYTVEAGKSLSDTWSVDAQGRYDLSVYGPNGFMRAFKGAVSQPAKANLDVDFSYDRDDRDIMLRITNLGRVTCRVTVTNIYDHGAATHVLRPGQSFRERWSLGSSFGWYDLSVEVDTDENFLRRLAGHVENGRDSVSDPALGGLRRIGHAQSRVAIVG
jgi:phospholipase C